MTTREEAREYSDYQIVSAVSPTGWRRLLVIGCVLAIFVGTIRTLQLPLNHDVSFLLEAARQINGGAVLYRDIIEINPPLIIWISQPIAALAVASGVNVGIVYRAIVLALAGLSLFATFRILSRYQAPSWPLRLAVGALAFAAVGYDFGQREHLLVLLTLPWLATVYARHAKHDVGNVAALAVGLAAGIGFVLKPQFLVVPLLLVVVTRRLPIETAVLVALDGFYGLAVPLVTPAYLDVVKTYGATYYHFLAMPVPQMLLTMPVMLAAFAFCFRFLRKQTEATVALIAASGGAIAVLAQGKGFPYHYYPVTVWAIISLVQSRALLVAGLSVALGVAVPPLLGATGGSHPARTAMLAVARTTPLHSAIVLSSQMFDAFPFVTEANVRWALRYPMAWVPQASYANTPTHTEPIYHDPASMDVVERLQFEQTLQDLAARPDLVGIESPHGFELRRGWRFDFYRYLAQDRRFLGIMADYDSVGTAGTLTLYRRRANARQASATNGQP